jgi:hypothetical protein
VERIQVAISGVSGVLYDVVATTLANAADLELVDPVSTEDLDVLIELHEDRAALDAPPALLVRQAQSRVLAIAEHGRESVLWELQPRRISLNELSTEGLLTAIRAAVQAPPD